MDVVYNHTYSLDSWFQRTAPWYFYRVFDDGRISNGSACGNDVASEREMCAKIYPGIRAVLGGRIPRRRIPV